MIESGADVSGDEPDPRIYASLAHLRGLEHRARRFSFLPRQPSRSALNGRHASRVRGRGLNFEELRDYLPGDDIRSIDWKVTARTGEPHVRVFTEERDRPALIVADQRLSMFFGSRLNMKSVTAAELAALAAWRVLAAGDRVGGIVFDDRGLVSLRPKRSRRAVNRFLETLSSSNLALRADSQQEPAPAMLGRALEAAARIAGHDVLVIVISDFDGADDAVRGQVRRLAMHNDVVLALVHDPIVLEVPAQGELVASDGQLQVQLDLTDPRARERLENAAGGRVRMLLDWQRETGASVLPVSAGEDTVSQVHRLMGIGPRRRRR